MAGRATHFYEVEGEELERFTGFLKLYETGIERARADQSLRLAARRFLRALFAGGPSIHPGSDSYEDALLQYVFALEALLTLGERRTIGRKLAERAAWLIGGRDEAKRERISTLIATLYHHRGNIVHGQPSDALATQGRSGRVTLLLQARDLVRQVLVVLIALNAAHAGAEESSRTLADLPVSRLAQDYAIDAASRSLPLIDARLDPYA